jgi:hypothetical protein
MSVTHTGFHAHSGWYFERQEDGSVKISAAVGRCTETIVLTAAEWPSVVAAVCADGETRGCHPLRRTGDNQGGRAA